MQTALTQFTASTTSTDSSGNTTVTPGPLTNDPTVLSLETQLANLINGSINGLGSFTSLAQLGVTFNQDGTLSFDQDTFNAAYEQDPNSVQSLLSTTTTGVGDQFKSVLQGLAANQNSLIADRNNSLSTQLTDNQQQITVDQTMLNNEQQRLLTEFYDQENVVAQLKNNLNIVNAIEPLTILGSRRRQARRAPVPAAAARPAAARAAASVSFARERELGTRGSENKPEFAVGLVHFFTRALSLEMKEHSMTPVAGTDYLRNRGDDRNTSTVAIDADRRRDPLGQPGQAIPREHDVQAAITSILRAQRIVTELLSGLSFDSEDGLVRRVAGVYLFIYRSLVAANLEHSTARLDDALRVLEFERETWRRVCEQLGAETHEAAAIRASPRALRSKPEPVQQAHGVGPRHR